MPSSNAVMPTSQYQLSSTPSTRSSFPFSFELQFQPNPSSTSLAQSTAEGRPIPVDDSTAEHRTTALREFNHNYPSRHQYAKSTGAQSSTYSEPVIVRSYYSPLLPNKPAGVSRNGIVVAQGGPGASPYASLATARNQSSISSMKRTPFTSAHGRGAIMARIRNKDGLLRSGSEQEEARLPPIEAFTFKNFLDNMQESGRGDDISADLDRIAEICARSRYSLSNQYEVHHSPHGSGADFANPPQLQEIQGPTLQAVTSDDESSVISCRRRTTVARRNSRAVGTLETIMSSSRSSDEDQSKKKSAAEIAEQVRGRARKQSIHSSSTETSPDAQRGLDSKPAVSFASRGARVSAPLALLESGRELNCFASSATPGVSVGALVGEPAIPQPSNQHLEIRTPASTKADSGLAPPTNREAFENGEHSDRKELPSSADAGGLTSFVSTLTGWLPWISIDDDRDKAVGSLRRLLRSSDVKVKSAATKYAP